MRQKYVISKTEDGKRLVITETAEIDKDIFSQLSETTYDMKDIRSAIKAGPEAFAERVRSRNFFPPLTTIQQIYAEMDGVNSLKSGDTIDVFTDDVDILAQQSEAVDVMDELDDDSEELDELLEDDVDVYDDNLSVKKLNSSLKVDDDEVSDDNGDM